MSISGPLLALLIAAMVICSAWLSPPSGADQQSRAPTEPVCYFATVDELEAYRGGVCETLVVRP